MATVRDLIYDAMYASGVLGQGDSAPSAADANIALRRLQRMLDAWSTLQILVYAATKETVTLVAGTGAYTTASLSTPTRPVAIDGGYVRYGDVDYTLAPLTTDQYNDISVKATQGIPESLHYEPLMPHGTLTFYPVPSAAMVAHLDCRRPLAEGMTLNTTLALPPGYEKAIVDNLAVELCSGGFGRAVTGDMIAMAKASKELIKRANYRPLVANTVFDNWRRYNIVGDE